MSSKKVAIVGAGAVGLYLARKLSQQEYRVEVFEAKQEVGKESCSGLISDRILDFVPEAERFVENKIERAKVKFPRKTITLGFSNDFLVLDRSKLDQKLADLAREAGAKIRLDHRVQQLPREFDYILGCDGARSQVRDSLGLNDLRYRMGVRGFSEQKSSEDLMETWPVTDGFIWRIPRGDRTEYGIMGPPEQAFDLLDDFIRQHDIDLKRISSDLIGHGFELSSDDQVALCGEAAGLTKGWSGGGIIWGLKAADLLLDNFPDLSGYRSELSSTFKRKIVVTDLITKMVYKVGFNFPYVIPGKLKMDSDFLIPFFSF